MGGLYRIVAVEQYKGKEMNPLVNAGAITTTSMLAGASRDQIWTDLLAWYGAFAGRRLDVDQEVFKSEATPTSAIRRSRC
jgi:glutaminase